jgi:hypothetical protein
MPTTTEQNGCLDTQAAASYLGISKSQLEKLRVLNNGPAYVRLGRRVVYTHDDLKSYLSKNRCDPTPSEAGNYG